MTFSRRSQLLKLFVTSSTTKPVFFHMLREYQVENFCCASCVGGFTNFYSATLLLASSSKHKNSLCFYVNSPESTKTPDLLQKEKLPPEL